MTEHQHLKNSLLFFSKLQIPLWNICWGTANKPSQYNLSIIVNEIIQSITYNSKLCKISEVCEQQTLLKITEIYELELGKLTYTIYNDLVPALYSGKKRIYCIHISAKSQSAMHISKRKETTICLVLKHHMDKKHWGLRGTKTWTNLESALKTLKIN